MSRVCASVALKYAEFSRAAAIAIGVMRLAADERQLKCCSHSSLNVPMLMYTRLSAPSAPTESAPSLSTRGVHTVPGAAKSVASGPSFT